jgi:hypothetical protein
LGWIANKTDRAPALVQRIDIIRIEVDEPMRSAIPLVLG